MKKKLCSFGDEKYYGSLRALERTSLKFGFDFFEGYTREWLKKTDFWEENKFILSQNRGAGYWIWKPYIILDSFQKMNDGDIVMYSDAAVTVINDPSPLFELAEKNSIVVFSVGGGILGDRKNKTWTKRDCMILMDADSQDFYEQTQTTGSFSLWKKDNKSINFLNKWLHFLKNPQIVTDSPSSIKSNLPSFIEHRHDQSVLSILSLKEKLERWRDPSQWGNEEIPFFNNSPYGQILYHHRMKLFG